jgi:hypothetical protein
MKNPILPIVTFAGVVGLVLVVKYWDKVCTLTDESRVTIEDLCKDMKKSFLAGFNKA